MPERETPTVDDLSPLSNALKPRLKLFLSVDLVGSTAFKQSQIVEFHTRKESEEPPPLGPAWFKSILSFFNDFEEQFLAQWRAYNAKDQDIRLRAPTPELWKSNGDELLYTFELTGSWQASAVIELWLKTLEGYRQSLKIAMPQLDIKSVAWLAGFPKMNSEVVLRTRVDEVLPGKPNESTRNLQLLNLWYEQRAHGDGGFTKDYIGPSIDIGFRLGSFATPRKLVLSVELAMMLCRVSLPINNITDFRIFFDGMHELKGVVGGKPYPIFWIRVAATSKIEEHYDQLAGLHPAAKEIVGTYCEEYIVANRKFLLKPFIIGCNETTFCNPPEGYLDELREWQSKLPKEAARDATETESLGTEQNKGGTELESSKISEFTGEIARKSKKGGGKRRRRGTTEE